MANPRPLVVVALGLAVLGVVMLGAAAALGSLAPPADGTQASAGAFSGDLGVALHDGDAALRGAFGERVVERQLENASDAEAGAIVLEHAAGAAAALERLGAAERDAHAAHRADGDAAETLRALARVDATAGVHVARVRTAREVAGNHLDPSTSAALRHLEDRLLGHTSPIRAAANEGARDPATALVTAVGTAPESLSVAAVVGDVYHREAVRFDRLDAGGEDRLGELAAAEAVVASTYPDTDTTLGARRIGDGRYLVERAGPEGIVLASVNGASEAVYRERQRVWLDAVSLESSAAATGQGLRVEVARTDGPGPMRIAVTDDDGDDPVAADVYLRVAGRWTRLGATGPDGIRWAPEPDGPYDVRIVRDGDIVTLGVA